MSEMKPLILNDENLPFVRKADAQTALKDKGLDASHTVIPYREGYALANLAAFTEMAAASTGGQVAPAPAPVTKYWWVRFHSKSNPGDPSKVELGLNGMIMHVNRDELVILPESFLEVAEHAVHDHYEQRPGFTRKIVSRVSSYPYTKVREGTSDEFRKFLANGNKLRDEEAQRLVTMKEAEAALRG